MTARTIRLGILGCGHVGAPLVALIGEQADQIEQRTNIRLEVAKVAVRNLARDRDVVIPEANLTRDAHAVVSDPDIDIVVEVIGGIEPARQLIATALKNGKPVVTANKELLANVGVELFQIADDTGNDLLFEAAVGGGIPLIRPLRESLRGEPVRRVIGIVNGTTNYILSKMTEEGAGYAEALVEAQQLGYAERDPTADVEGYDAAAKAAIIATIAFGSKVVAGDVYHEGISGITAFEIAMAQRLGYVVKLLAIAERDARTGEIGVRVHPAMVPQHHPLASVRESFNAVFVEGEAVGSLMFYGRGAGGRPSASAVLGDIIDAAVNLTKGTHATLGSFAKAAVRPIDETVSAFLMSLDVADQPGVLHAVTGVFAGHGVSIRAAEQEGIGPDARLVFITHHAKEASIQATLRELRDLDVVRHVGGLLRVIGDEVDGSLRYVSTRGQAPELGFADVLLSGLANDGGLYVPATWPELPDTSGLHGYAAVAAAVMAPFAVGDDGVDWITLDHICADAYRAFDHAAVAPITQIDDDHFLLELFHGPTLAFKDIALQVVGRLFDHVLAERKERVTIVGATSGDTGSAAIDAVKGCDNVDIVILYPAGRVSDVQRRQMTTVDAPNVHTAAVDGNFDDCQDLVKALFADTALRDDVRLSAVNSINWARVMAQVVYYVTACRSLQPPLTVAVPTGNFGNVLAGWIARHLGAPIRDFIISSNVNDILTRLVNDRDMSTRAVVPTLSPSMDIQVSSNFERFLFEMNGRDGGLTAEQLTRFRAVGRLDVEDDQYDRWIRGTFRAARIDDAATIDEIARVYATAGVLVDPHTATATAAANALASGEGRNVVSLATAHPAKFPDAVERATGVRPPVPDRLHDALERPERSVDLPNDLAAVRTFVRSVSRA